jgi:hypothetical protein
MNSIPESPKVEESKTSQKELIPLWPTVPGTYALASAKICERDQKYHVEVYDFKQIKGCAYINGEVIYEEFDDDDIFHVYELKDIKKFTLDEYLKYIEDSATVPGLVFTLEHSSNRINSDIKSRLELFGEHAEKIKDILRKAGRRVDSSDSTSNEVE